METKAQAERRDRELNPEVAQKRRELYQKYIVPYDRLIRYLCKRYSASPDTVDDNYSLALVNLFRGIESYNPEQPIRTWIHICTKRHILEQEKRRSRLESMRDRDHDIADVAPKDVFRTEVSANVMDETNYKEFLSDDVLMAIESLSPIHKDAFLLQVAGYSLKEIVEIEHQKGRLESKNIDTIKSRLFLARQTLIKKLNRNGTRKTG